MKLKKESSVLNFGDTSFRRKKYMSEYRTVLGILARHMANNQTWVKNQESQSEFYSTVVETTDLFNRSEESDSKLAKRGRTLTNSIVKTGLIDEKRKISDAGYAWLNNNLAERDTFEKVLDISDDNLIFFRQWSKVRLYNVDGDHYIKPFLFLLKFLSVYKRVPQDDLLKLLHLLSPNLNDSEMNGIIKSYKHVSNNEMIFSEYVEKYINTDREKTINSNKINELFSESPIDKNEFNEYFKNGKSIDKAGQIYLNFVESLLSFKNNPNNVTLVELIKVSKNEKVKKAFGNGSNPFVIPKVHDLSVESFNEKNQENALLHGNNIDIYNTFKISKLNDLIKEYGDMTYRLTNLAGIISYDNKLVDLPLQLYFAAFFKKFNIDLSGDEPYADYDGNLHSMLYANESFTTSLGLEKHQVNLMLKEFMSELNLTNINELIIHFRNENDKRFKEMVQKKFPKAIVIRLLKDFVTRNNDSEIKKLVSENAPIADIFEYILGICWFYISEGKVNIRKSFKMSLDANFLPLSHAAGYQGDIELRYKKKTVLLEATLMGKSTQKRGELEPVIRHTVNLTAEDNELSEPRTTQTIFVASELDDNVINIFRSTNFIELHHSVNNKTVNGVNIFALSITDIINILNEGVSDNKIVTTINDNLMQIPSIIRTGWRDNIVSDILN